MNKELQIQVITYILTRDDRFLAEKRSPNSLFANHVMFPGGTVEKHESDDIEIALRREVVEELGVEILEYTAIPVSERIYGRNNATINPFLVTNWRGDLPDRILDTGAELLWTDIHAMINSPLEVVTRVAIALRDYLATCQS